MITMMLIPCSESNYYRRRSSSPESVAVMHKISEKNDNSKKSKDEGKTKKHKKHRTDDEEYAYLSTTELTFSRSDEISGGEGASRQKGSNIVIKQVKKKTLEASSDWTQEEEMYELYAHQLTSLAIYKEH
jgi:hypothetical protein